MQSELRARISALGALGRQVVGPIMETTQGETPDGRFQINVRVEADSKAEAVAMLRRFATELS
jgi:hypothetical protein